MAYLAYIRCVRRNRNGILRRIRLKDILYQGIKKIYNPWVSRLKKISPQIILRFLPNATMRWTENALRELVTPKPPPPVLSAEAEARVREILVPEVRGVYHYLGIEHDPWHFFEKNHPNQDPSSSKCA